MKKIIQLFSSLVPAFLFISIFASSAGAVFFQTGDSLVIPKEKIINETAVISGSSLTINSNINGDLLCAGQNVVINGNIKGDVICFGQNIKINGTVDGNVRAAGQTIEIFGQVTRNLSIASQQLVLDSKSQIKGDVFFGVQNVELGGVMGRDLAGAGDSITITGSLLRNAVVTGTKLSIIETGKIGGNLDYYMEKTATASIGEKTVKGNILRHDIVTPSKPALDKKMAGIANTAIILKTIFGILSFGLLGLAIVFFDKKDTKKKISAIINKPLVSGLIGLAILITAPLVFIIILATVIGMPLAFVVMFVYIIALITASLYPSAIYGKLFFEKVLQKTNTSLYSQMFMGVILLGLVSIIPVIGWIIAFVSFCMGLGASLVSMFPEKAETKN
ncbi:MAG: polymer-forming cytoskeletal protein [Microgenomates group bacterium]